MKRTWIIGAACAVSLTAQQEKQIKLIEKEDVVIGTPAQGVSFISSEMSWEEKILKGQPYSAEAVTETTQFLADGNRITRKQTSQLYRDSDGRTRREQSLGAVGPWASGQEFKTIFINDPVARVNWVLNPQEKTARKLSLAPAGGGEPYVQMLDKIKVEGTLVGGMGASAVRVPAPEGVVVHDFEAATTMGRVHAASGTQTLKNTPLGQQVIEGVTCEGTRTTVTIPAGEIGNDRAIDIVSEKWVSEELGVTVLSKRSDPRAGETVYRLSNLRRGEPARDLFEPSAEYKVETGDKIFMRRRAPGNE